MNLFKMVCLWIGIKLVFYSMKKIEIRNTNMRIFRKFWKNKLRDIGKIGW